MINGRDAEKLEKTAAELRNLPGIDREVVAVAADITTDAGRAALLAACPAPDILVLNNRGPKPGILADQTAENFEEALTLHFRTPLALLMAVLPGMKERGWGRIVCITSAMVTAPEEVQVASASARAAQTALMKAASFDAAAHGVTINFLQPARHRLATAARRRPTRGREARSVVRGGLGAAGVLGRGEAFRHADGVRQDVRVRVQRPRRLHVGHQPAPRGRYLHGDRVR